jgi:hypothetical protein
MAFTFTGDQCRKDHGFRDGFGAKELDLDLWLLIGSLKQVYCPIVYWLSMKDTSTSLASIFSAISRGSNNIDSLLDKQSFVAQRLQGCILHTEIQRQAVQSRNNNCTPPFDPKCKVWVTGLVDDKINVLRHVAGSTLRWFPQVQCFYQHKAYTVLGWSAVRWPVDHWPDPVCDNINLVRSRRK